MTKGEKGPKAPKSPVGTAPLHLMPQALRIECPSFYPETVSTPVDSEGTARLNGVSLRRGEDNEYSKGQRWWTAEGIVRLNVEWERPKRAKRPNKPNKPNRHSYITHCSLHLMSQALRMECPSVGVRTMSAARDSKEEGSVPQVSSDVFVVRGSEVGHLSGLKIERTMKRFFC